MKLRDLLIAGLSATVMLAGCGAEGPDSGRTRYESEEETDESSEKPAEKDEETEVTEYVTPADPVSEREPDPADAPVYDTVFSSEFINLQVENNGDYFVRVGNKVYFRDLSPMALDSAAMFGEFLGYENHNAASKLYCYDLAKEDCTELCEVNGSGKLFASVFGFFLGTAEDYSTLLVNPVTGEEIKYCDGKPIAVSPDGQFLAVRYVPDRDNYDPHYRVIYNGRELCDVSSNENGILEFYGFCGDFLIGCFKEDNYFYLAAMSPEGEITEMGEISNPIGEPYNTPYPELIQFEQEKDNAYILLGYFEGTGHFLSSWLAVKCDPFLEGSLSTISTPYDVSTPEDLVDSLPWLLVEGEGEAVVYPGLHDEIYLSEVGYGDLIYRDSPFSAVKLWENYFYRHDGEGGPNEWKDFIQASAVFDNKAFIMRMRGFRVEEADVGWRSCWGPFDMTVEVIPFAGKDLNEYGLPKEKNTLDYVFLDTFRSSFEEAAGTWDLYSSETEGAYQIYEDAAPAILTLEEDGTISVNVSVGQPAVYDLVYNGISENGKPLYTTEAEDHSNVTITIDHCIGNRLQLTWDWQRNDGTYAYGIQVYHRQEDY